MPKITFHQMETRRAKRRERVKGGLFIGACLLVMLCSVLTLCGMERQEREARAANDAAYCAMAGASPTYCYHIKH